ncbi:MAG: acyl-[acyl-carrier-protein] thioesterase [Acidimicrobiales bacterium]
MAATPSVFVPVPEGGRIFRADRRVSIDDAAPDGRMQIDAVARFLQDVGNDDTEDAGFPRLGLAWVARRMVVHVVAAPISRELLAMTTWCSGTGSRWAERRTNVLGEHGGQIEAATIWVYIDVETGRPAPWNDVFADLYMEATQGREVAARLEHPKTPDPDEPTTTMSWSFRASDMDAFGHVNNAAYPAVLEELDALHGHDDVYVEVEWRKPSTAGELLTVVSQSGADGRRVWLTAAGELRATFLVRG